MCCIVLRCVVLYHYVTFYIIYLSCFLVLGVASAEFCVHCTLPQGFKRAWDKARLQILTWQHDPHLLLLSDSRNNNESSLLVLCNLFAENRLGGYPGIGGATWAQWHGSSNWPTWKTSWIQMMEGAPGSSRIKNEVVRHKTRLEKGNCQATQYRIAGLSMKFWESVLLTKGHRTSTGGLAGSDSFGANREVLKGASVLGAWDSSKHFLQHTGGVFLQPVGWDASSLPSSFLESLGFFSFFSCEKPETLRPLVKSALSLAIQISVIVSI